MEAPDRSLESFLAVFTIRDPIRIPLVSVNIVVPGMILFIVITSTIVSIVSISCKISL